MKCFICENSKSNAYYSPKSLYKFNIYLCSKCVKLIKNVDFVYLENTNKVYAENEVKKETKRLVKKR